MAQAAPAALERHPHLAEPLQPGWVRVDCHSHSMWSGDSTTTPEELAEAVAESGIDVLCLTDHNEIKGAVRLASELDCRVVVGEEMRTSRGEVIGLFMTERLPFGMTPIEAAEAVRAQGGLVYIPHPFDPLKNCLDPDSIDDLLARGLVDLLEGLNGKTSLASLNAKAVARAREAGVAAGAGSDAHVPDALGAAYVEMPNFEGPADFLRAVAGGRLVGHHYDAPRRWRPRIVPSVE